MRIVAANRSPRRRFRIARSWRACCDEPYRYGKPKAIELLREKLAQHLGEAARTMNKDLEERHARLTRIEQRIEKLVTFISDGGDSDAVRTTLKDMEAQKKAELEAVESLRGKEH